MPLPQYLGGVAGNQQDQLLDFYLNHNNPSRDPAAFYDTDEAAAEQAVASGGQQFSGARGGLLRRSQIMQNLAAAAPILEARAGRVAQHASQTQSETAALAQLAQAGAQAEKLEQLRQRGQLTAQTQAEAAVTRETILRGQQAIQQLQQSQMGQQVLAQIGINANKELQAAKFANDNWQLQEGNRFTAAENAANRTFSAGQATANRTGQFQLAGVNNNAALQRTRISNPTFDDNATTEMLNQIRASTSGNTITRSGASGLPSTATPWTPWQSPTSGAGYDSSGNPVATAQPSYYFGDNSPNSNAAGIQKYGGGNVDDNNRPISDEDLYYLTGGEFGG